MKLRATLLNILEHTLTRGMDAAVSILLVYALSAETFAQVSISAAIAAPCLFFFLAPWTVIYRDFSKWRDEGQTALRARLRVNRIFAWTMFGVALLLAVGLSYLDSVNRVERMLGMGWAFALMLTPYVCGVDREYLRLELRLKTLNFLTLLQKLSLGLGVLVLVALGKADVRNLMWVSYLVLLISALSARWAVHQTLKLVPESTPFQALSFKESMAVLWKGVSSFSLWQHLTGVILNFVQTMDLFMMGLSGVGQKWVGLYSACLKIANFSQAIPLAIANSFAVRLGRVLPGQASGQSREKREILKWSLVVTGFGVIQAGLISILVPWIIQFFSHGRWTASEQAKMVEWTQWILFGTLPVAVCYCVTAWLAVRARAVELFFSVYLPWGIAASLIYRVGSAHAALTDNPIRVAQLNLLVGVIHLLLVLFEAYRAFGNGQGWLDKRIAARELKKKETLQ